MHTAHLTTKALFAIAGAVTTVGLWAVPSVLERYVIMEKLDRPLFLHPPRPPLDMPQAHCRPQDPKSICLPRPIAMQ